MGKHDCPQCGQDMRLPPNAAERLAKVEKLIVFVDREPGLDLETIQAITDYREGA